MKKLNSKVVCDDEEGKMKKKHTTAVKQGVVAHKQQQFSCSQTHEQKKSIKTGTQTSAKNFQSGAGREGQLVEKAGKRKGNTSVSENRHNESKNTNINSKKPDGHKETKKMASSTSIKNYADNRLNSKVTSPNACAVQNKKEGKMPENNCNSSFRLISPCKCTYRGKSFVRCEDTAKHFCKLINDHPGQDWVKWGVVPKETLRDYYTDTYKPAYNNVNQGDTIFQFSKIYFVSMYHSKKHQSM